jgi:PKD repeat protein
VNFDASGSTTPSGAPINNYRWNFGDGTIISGPGGNAAPAPGGTMLAPRHTFGTAGSYTVTLTVTDTNNQTGSATQTVTVAP